MSFGGKGTSVNFSARGARTTFGLPGTGLSWTSSAGGGRRRSQGTRRPSLRQIEATTRRAAKAQLAAAAQAAVEKDEERHRDVVEAWRDLPDVPDASFYEDACQLRPFSFDEPPGKPEEATAKAALRQEVERAAVAQARNPAALCLAVSAAGFVGGALLFLVHAYAGLVTVVLAPLVLWLETSARWRQQLKEKVDPQIVAQWPRRWAHLIRVHETELADYHVRRLQAEADWDVRERDRVAWAQRVRSGDPDTVETTLAETLSDLDFPFETRCAVAVTDSRTAYVLLDLPEIEDVIPETRSKALKDGRIKQVKRTKGERFADHARLSAGLAVLLARTAFAAGPTLQMVHVAAYTQRRQRSWVVVRDEFVYEVGFSRQQVATVDPDKIDPLELVGRAQSRISIAPSGELKEIPAPEWIDLIATEGTYASPDDGQ